LKSGRHPLAAMTSGMLLLSGGFDSPVAGHMMRERGLSLRGVHFSLEPVTDDASTSKARELARLLGIPDLAIVLVGKAFGEVASKCAHRYYFVLSKRLMVRLAGALARPAGCDFLITGENLGQVSSQTMQNLAVIDEASALPVLRPLIGFDKQEIIDRAKRLGTHDISVGQEICDILGPDRPATWAPLRAILAEEAKLDVPALVDRTLAESAKT